MLRYQIESLTLEELKELIANADDQYNNQLRVNNNGEVYISRTVGAENIYDLRFRFETFDAGNDYVGINAANDLNYVQDTFNRLKKCWDEGRSGYIDY